VFLSGHSKFLRCASAPRSCRHTSARSASEGGLPAVKGDPKPPPPQFRSPPYPVRTQPPRSQGPKPSRGGGWGPRVWGACRRRETRRRHHPTRNSCTKRWTEKTTTVNSHVNKCVASGYCTSHPPPPPKYSNTSWYLERAPRASPDSARDLSFHGNRHPA